MSDASEIECPDCGGHGHILKRDLRLGPGMHEMTCEACNGHGWRAMTQDEIDDAAADAFSDMCEGEPPISMREAHEAAWQQHQEAHHG